jgi:hypothetical protein
VVRGHAVAGGDLCAEGEPLAAAVAGAYGAAPDERPDEEADALLVMVVLDTEEA